MAHDEMLKREDLWKELKRQLSDLSGFLVGLIALGLVQVVGPLGFSLDCDPHRCLRLLGLGVPTKNSPQLYCSSSPVIKHTVIGGVSIINTQ